MLRVHGKPFIAVEADVDAVAGGAARRGYPVMFGDVARPGIGRPARSWVVPMR